MFCLAVEEGKQSPAGAAQEFCVRTVKLCGKGKKAKCLQTWRLSFTMVPCAFENHFLGRVSRSKRKQRRSG